MSDSGSGLVSQVVVVNAPKVSDFEERLNHVLAKISPEHLVNIDYLHDDKTYGLVAVVRYLT